MRVAVLLCWTLCVLCSTARADAGPVLVFGASLPEIGAEPRGEGLPQLASLVRAARDGAPTFFLFGGDSLGPSMLGSLDRGTHIIDLLNQMEPDAWGVSKREFLFQEDELSLRAAEAFFPMVSSNIEDPATGGNLTGLENSVIIRRGGVNLGVMAMMGPRLLGAYPPQRVRLLDADASLRRTARELREQGADMVALMVDYELPRATAYLEEGVIDILLGNSGTKVGRVPTKRGVYLQLDDEGAAAVELDLGTGEARFHALHDLPSEPAMQARVDAYRAQMEKILTIEVGATSTPLNTERSAVRSGENAFGNFVADAMRHTLRADVAMINGGFIRGNRQYEAGTRLLRRDVRAELPFYDEVALIEVSGQNLLDALENGFSQVESLSGRFPHVSGMHVAYRPANPSGRRVVSVTVGGRPLDPQARYTLAATHYLATGGDDYDSLATGRPLQTPAVLLGDLVRQRIEEMGVIAPVVDHRLRAVD